MSEKIIQLKLDCRRGASFNGAPEENAALGGSNSVDSVGFNYYNYIQSTFNLLEHFNLNLIEVQNLRFKIYTSGSLSGKPVTINVQTTINSNNDYITFTSITNNSISYVQIPYFNEILDKSNSVIFTTELQKAKLYVSRIELIVTYRELEDWEIPDEFGKIDLIPEKPTIQSINGDIDTKNFEKSFEVNLSYTSGCNYVLLDILDNGGRVVAAFTHPSKRKIIINSTEFNCIDGMTYFVRAKLINVNGSSDWSELSSGLLKCKESKISITSVTGNNIVQHSNSPVIYYMNEYAKVNGVFSPGREYIGLSLTELSQFDVGVVLQQQINGIWKDISYEESKTDLSLQYSIELDANNEDENGGLDYGCFKLIRVKGRWGNKYCYSSPITIFRVPLPEISINESYSYKRLSISDIKISGFVSSLHPYNYLCNISVYRQLIDNLDLVKTITIDLMQTNKYNIDLNSLIGNKLNYGDNIVLGYSTCNINGVYGDELMGTTIYQLSELLPSPLIQFMDIYDKDNLNSPNNGYFIHSVKLSWNKINPIIFPEDRIVYNVYRNDVLIKTTSLTEFNDVPPYNLNSVVYKVSVTNGYDEFISPAKARTRAHEENVRPTFKNGIINLKPLSSFLNGTNELITTSSSIPMKMVISFPRATSITTKTSDLQYVLHIKIGSDKIHSVRLNNVIYNNINSSNEAIIDLANWGCKPGDTIQLFMTCIDRFGFESASRI